jgi:hypothetical protein
MALPSAPFTKTFAQIVADFTAQAQASSNVPLDFSEGSIFLALGEAVGGNVDWLQKLYLFALLVERLQTSQGPWVDSWTADFMPVVPGTNSPRLPASPAAGMVTFSRFAPQSQVVVPVGALVASFDGSKVYQVHVDLTNSAYSATIIPGGGYILLAGQSSLNVAVTALTPGSGGNVLPNTITLIQSSMVGIDAVTNPAPFVVGLDPESDAALKARFKLFILSLRAGTEGAIGFAITSLQQGLQYVIHENVDPNGAIDYGAVTVYVDDGSGNPPATTVSLANVAVNNIRAAGVRPAVLAATTLLANVSLSIAIAAGYQQPAVIAAVQNAVGAYLDDLGLETLLPYTMIENVAYQASAGVTNVTSVLVNGGTADLTPGMGITIKAGILAVA